MNLKKILLFLPLLTVTTAIYCALPAAYVPTAGPIPLADGMQAGAITATLMHNRALASQKAKIIQFLPGNLPAHAPLPAYQRVIDMIIPAQAPEALHALEAYADAIMHIYQEKAYLIKAGNLPHLCPIRGIRSPLSNENQLNQLLDEYDQLATIALEKSALVGARMKANVKTYKYWYWKTATAILATAYTIYDLKVRGAKDGLIANLLHCNFGKIFTNLKADLGLDNINHTTNNSINNQINKQIKDLEQQKVAILNGKKIQQTDLLKAIDNFISPENAAIAQLEKTKKAKIIAAFEREKKHLTAQALQEAIHKEQMSYHNLSIEQKQALKEFEAYMQKNPHYLPQENTWSPYKTLQKWSTFVVCLGSQMY